MEWKYSSHAVDRMLQRNISVAEVEEVLSKPDGKIQQSSDKWIFFRKIIRRKDNRLAAVVVTYSGNSNEKGEVLTVMNHFEVK